MSKTQIRGAHRIGAGVLDEGDATRAVVASYSGLTTREAQKQGPDAAGAVLPARRALWLLAERHVPLRLAAALRARCSTSDPTARDGVRELRLAIADWLDPPPVCRRAACRRAVRPGHEDAPCPASASGRPCSPRVPRAGKGAVARCGTLALYPAGLISLEVLAAATRHKTGAASGYDVAADRDCKALLAATAEAPPRDPTDEHADRWEDQYARALHLAVQGAKVVDGGRLPGPAVAACRAALQAARGTNLRVNGRLPLAVQLRYTVPSGGVCRADLVQGAAVGADRAALDFDRTRAGYASYGGNWMRQGAQEELAARDVVGTPYGVVELRRKVEERLHLAGPTAIRELLRAIDTLSNVASHQETLQTRHHAPAQPDGAQRRGGTSNIGHEVPHGLDRLRATEMGGPLAQVVKLADLNIIPDELQGREGIGQVQRVDGVDHGGEAGGVTGVHGPHDAGARGPSQASLYSFTPSTFAAASALCSLLRDAEVKENIAGTRPPRYSRRRLYAQRSPAAEAEASAAALPPPPKARKGKAALLPTPAEDPEVARERLAAWVAGHLELACSGPRLLEALRHGAPVLVQIGAGGDDDEDAQGTDGAGGTERAAAVLASPDDEQSAAEEDHARARWRAALAALAELRGETSEAEGRRGAEMAEVVRRHHGLDSVAEHTSGAGGESFAAIAEAGLATTGRRVTSKEAIRKIYQRGIEALRAIIAGTAPDLGASDEDDEVDISPYPAGRPRSPWKPLRPAEVVSMAAAPMAAAPTAAPPVREDDGGAWAAWREGADAVVW